MRRTTLLTLLALLCLTACNDDDYLPPYESSLVVEGWIEDGDFPVVMLSRTYPVMEEKTQVGDLSDYVLRWAVVTISCDDRSVVLTGMRDDNYFPPYIYTTGEMRGEAGKHYTLTVKYRQMYAEATTFIPPAPQLEKLRVEPVAGEDTLRTLVAGFTDPADEQNYYQFFVKKGKESSQYLASYLGSVDDRSLNGYTEQTVYQGHKFPQKHYHPYFAVGDTIFVKLAQVDSHSYAFWSDYDKSLTLSNNMMYPKSTNLPSNIDGAIGYWCGMGSSTQSIVIK